MPLRVSLSLNQDAERLAALLHQAGPRGTVVFTGAGVSTESGIPDFRSPGTGLWAQNAPIAYQDFLADPVMRRESWRRGANTYPPLAAALPNPAHLAIAEWHRTGLLLGVVTQNIDALHQRAGVPDEAVAELHGTAHRVDCLRCGTSYPRAEVQDRVARGEAEPACGACGGILKPATVSFGQPLPVDVLDRAVAWLSAARLCLVIGSSLVVYPAAGLPELTLRAGGALAIVNATQTHLDPRSSYICRYPAGQLLGQVGTLMRANG